MGRLEGKVAIVTGAAGGIGQCMVTKFAEEGARIVATDLDMAATELPSKQGTLAVQADVTSAADRERLLATTVETMGRVDLLLNNAGIVRFQEITEVTEANWDAVFEVNLKAGFFLMQAVIRQMRIQGDGGKIVNIASTSGTRAEPFTLPYAASKAGVMSMTRSAAVAVGDDHINVNAICPGPTRTDMSMSIYVEHAARTGKTPEDIVRGREEIIPTGRMTEPAEIAAMAAFLCSRDADNITGQAYTVDGGFLLKA